MWQGEKREAEFSEVQFAIGRHFYFPSLLYLQRQLEKMERVVFFYSFVIVVESWEAEKGESNYWYFIKAQDSKPG